MRYGVWVLVVLLAVGDPVGVAASDYFGQVTFNGLPVPGATVTAKQGERAVSVATDEEGIYHLTDLANGLWTLTIEMFGFTPVEREIAVPAEKESPPEALAVRSLDELTRATPAISTADSVRFPRVTLKPLAAPAGAPGVATAQKPLVDLATLVGPTEMGAAEGLLINGSLNNGASTPFALPRAIGNNRPRPPTMRSYSLGLQFGHSAWDATPYSLTGAAAAKPSYTDTQLLGMFESQVRVPGLRNALTVNIGYQGSSATTANMQSARVPTDRERGGDFSQTLDPSGRPVRIVDPLTGQPFEGSVIPADRISPQASSLVALYPHADPAAPGRFNYQVPLVTGTRQDAVRSRVAYRINSRQQISGGASYQRGNADTTTLFGFTDSRHSSPADAQASWQWTPSRTTNLTLRYGYQRAASDVVPFFANRLNVSGLAGIEGNDQDPRNWGPPSLTFASDLAGLSDGRSVSTTEQAHIWAADVTKTHGRHNIGFGGEFRLRRNDVFGQQDPRGTFGFTGEVTGLDFADFLLGLPRTSGIAVGNPDKHFRGSSVAAFITDDLHAKPSLTLTYGLRWEYEAPVHELQGRLANLDVTPDFSAVSEVVAGATGSITGTRYSNALVHADWRGLQPRVGLAWRPTLGSSLAIRGGYGLYRNTNVYLPIASLLAVQPPFSTTFNIVSTPANPLTLANGFTPGGDAVFATFAIDPDFRVSSAHNWDVSVQRDLPGALTILATYLGSRGTHLMQMFLPNTYPAGADDPCVTCPVGFRYLTSNGHSIRHAGAVQVRRRLSGGFTAMVEYTLATARDNAAAFSGATLDSTALAQNWRDLDAEYARSNFDQRHLVTASVEHTTGVGIGGGTLLEGWQGRLLQDWTFMAAFSAGSGLPLTPVYFAPIGGTGVIGSLRPDVTGVPNDPAPGSYANAAAFSAPVPGRFGNSTRNSITGPSTFSLNAGVTRTFHVNSRLNFDWRIDATNVLNRVTYASVNMLITSPQFGLPNRANDMRKLRTSIRIRF